MPERILQMLNELYSSFAQAFPNFIAAIAIFIIGYMIAKMVARVINRVLKSIGIDRLAEKLNEIDFIEKSNFNIVPSKILSKIVYYVLLLIFTIIATEILNIAAVSQLVRDIINYIPSVIAAIAILILGLLIAQALQKIVLTTTQSLGIPSAKIIAGFIFYFVFLMTIITALTQIGIETDFIATNITAIIAGSVLAFGLGYGLASKDTMANFLASFYSKDKIGVGDIIAIDGIKGEVIKIESTSLMIRDEEKDVIIPLSKLTTGNVEIYKRNNN